MKRVLNTFYNKKIYIKFICVIHLFYIAFEYKICHCVIFSKL